ncbi:uncharacterized protein TNCT_192651 [Trichonephila clavata]|uniref:Histone H1 n=1 Tax=Trichonephila clavata TaxID=2740835 RepID=A0A8X6FVD9_TRICU|nr:uncharacterized protein TNCT_192651 [Trichonephila clavata]
MKTTNAVHVKKNKQNIEVKQICHWILKSVSNIPPERAVTFHYIKKFLESKQNGISNHPETKLALKRLIDGGHLMKVNGKIARGKLDEKDKKQCKENSKGGSKVKSHPKVREVRKE